VAVLAEDERHQGFVRRYLYRLGYSGHDLYPDPLPSGRGCGEQWVRERYATAVGTYRARSKHARTALIVAIDADKAGLGQRRRQFSGLPRRGDDERIVHLIPKRNIETWILCLSGRQVDEETDYSRDAAVDDFIATAADRFFEWSRTNAPIPGSCIPSLSAAIPEIRRLDL